MARATRRQTGRKGTEVLTKRTKPARKRVDSSPRKSAGGDMAETARVAAGTEATRNTPQSRGKENAVHFGLPLQRS